jgi:hypothetical protein
MLVGSGFDFSRHLARRGNGESLGRLFHPFSFASIHTILDPGGMPGGDRSARAEWVHSPAGSLGVEGSPGGGSGQIDGGQVGQRPRIVPGQKSSLVAVITDADGKVLQTEGTGQGKVLWSDLKITASVVTAKVLGHRDWRGGSLPDKVRRLDRCSTRSLWHPCGEICLRRSRVTG